MIELNVNGQTHQIHASPEMPLLWALRDLIGLTGTKFGCGEGLCGACTVHLDGQAARACQTPVGTIGSRQVTTIEGIRADHPVKQAWKAHHVPQCGYCQPGQIMSACALLQATADPSSDDIESGMAGNICRCGTYPRIRQAIRQAAGEMGR